VSGHAGRPKERKRFFFEKKKQKTFVIVGSPAAYAKGKKFFGSFFQKRTFFFPLAMVFDQNLRRLQRGRRGACAQRNQRDRGHVRHIQ
jgi:hypothetical protein